MLGAPIHVCKSYTDKGMYCVYVCNNNQRLYLLNYCLYQLKCLALLTLLNTHISPLLVGLGTP